MHPGSGRSFSIALITMLLITSAVPAQRGGRGGDRLDSTEAEAELQTAIALTRRGQFQDAIPHFLSVRGRVREDYAANFNLALCYLGTRQFDKSIEILKTLASSGQDMLEVENLLAQSYIGANKPEAAFAALQHAARMDSKNEKLYLYVADACMESGQNELGLKVVELGMRSLPKSARLIFERAIFLSEMDDFDRARADFQRTEELAPGSEIAYIAGAQRALYEGKMEDAARIAREGIEKGNDHFLLLSIFGEAVLSSGAAPVQPDFADAQAALEKVVSEHPNFSSAQIMLGKLYLQAGRSEDAIARLEAARALNARNPAVYSNLAIAYRKLGDAQKAQAALAELARLNQQQIEKIGSAPGDRKAGYASHGTGSIPPRQN